MKDLRNLHRDFIRMKTYARRVSPVTLRGYESAFDLLMKIIPGVNLNNLNAYTFLDFFEQLEKRERTVGRNIVKIGVRKSTIATYWSKLNQFMIWLKANGHIEQNPFEDKILEFPNVRYDDLKYLPQKKVEKIFSTINFNMQWKNNFVKKRNHLILTLALWGGLRKGEILGLQLLDIDLDKKQLTVRAETSKSRLTRRIPLNTLTIQAIQDYLQYRGEKKYTTDNLLVSNNKDKKFTEHGLKHLIAQLNEESGVKFHIHQFRHTYAMNLINSGYDCSMVKTLLGHRDIRMTEKYLRCMPTEIMQGNINKLSFENLI
ncbi:site-specific integrase [bacterium]|jgi:integrase/recombinase XerD|nr:site-specific integrase [bacterium]MBT4121494.1 site-specific integrase [bacterium]